jgi:acyl-coenzyme A thioesterase PaaI-like protein
MRMRSADTFDSLASGSENPVGVHLAVRWEGDRLFADVTLDDRHEGWGGYAHGGVLAILFDEMLGRVVELGGVMAVTAHLEVDFRAPVLLGQPLTLEAWDASDPDPGRKRRPRGVLRDGAGTILAEGSGLWLAVDDSHYDAGRANSA